MDHKDHHPAEVHTIMEMADTDHRVHPAEVLVMMVTDHKIMVVEIIQVTAVMMTTMMAVAVEMEIVVVHQAGLVVTRADLIADAVANHLMEMETADEVQAVHADHHLVVPVTQEIQEAAAAEVALVIQEAI